MTREEAKEILRNCDDIVWREKHHITMGKIDDALALAEDALSSPWHKVSEENKLPKKDTFMVSYPAKFYPEFCYYEKHLDMWVVNNLALTFEAFKKMFTHWMYIPEIKED